MPINLQVKDKNGQWWVRQNTCGLGYECAGFSALCDEETTSVYAVRPSEPKDVDVQAAELVIKKSKKKKEQQAVMKRPLNASTYNHASDPAKQDANRRASKDEWRKAAADANAKALRGRGLPGGAEPSFITQKDKETYWRMKCAEQNARMAARKDGQAGGSSSSGGQPGGPSGPA
jgi:hypothetical protein